MNDSITPDLTMQQSILIPEWHLPNYLVLTKGILRVVSLKVVNTSVSKRRSHVCKSTFHTSGGFKMHCKDSYFFLIINGNPLRVHILYSFLTP